MMIANVLSWFSLDLAQRYADWRERRRSRRPEEIARRRREMDAAYDAGAERRAAWKAHEDAVCEHGTALDVHCCNCHSGFLFNPEQCHCGFDVLCESCRKGLHYGAGEVCFDADDVPLCVNCMAELIERQR